MAITTLDGLLAGMQQPVNWVKATWPFKAAGVQHSSFYIQGFPGPAVASVAGLAGEALTSYAGQLSFPATVGGQQIYIARIEGSQSSVVGAINLMDRLWQNSGFVVTSTGAQTINSVAWPARDLNSSTNGTGVMLAMEVTTTLGAGTPTLTVTYTNSAGLGSRTGTIGPILTTCNAGTFYPMALAAGDLGVRSVQSITSSATMTSGAVSFVAYRVMCVLPMGVPNYATDRDAVALGFPKCSNSSVPWIVYTPSGTTSTSTDGTIVWAQG